jgi:hypothetical protein|tara:strand:+ start:223 stop:456 length:234 start_codon:yes stop_codon:yes gene_type:complete
MRIKTIYDKLKPEFKTELQVNARKYSTAKRLKYILMSKTSWYDLTINDVSDMTVYCNVKLYNMSGSDIMYGKSMLKD